MHDGGLAEVGEEVPVASFRGWHPAVTEMIRAASSRADITPETSLAEDLGIESLTMMEVIMAAEDRFGLLIDDDDWPRFKTVLDAARYIDRAASGPADHRA
jgi:acyl carrier protein